MTKYQPKITAKTAEEFEKISKALTLLPESILENIEHAEFGGVGIHCTFSRGIINGEKATVSLPNYTRQISDFGDYIGIYSGKFFFEIVQPAKKYPITYLFVEANQEGNQ